MEAGDTRGDGVPGRHRQTRTVTGQCDTSMQRSDTELLAVKKVSSQMVGDHFFDVSGYSAAATPTRRDLRQKIGDRPRPVSEPAEQRVDLPPGQSQPVRCIIGRFRTHRMHLQQGSQDSESGLCLRPPLPRRRQHTGLCDVELVGVHHKPPCHREPNARPCSALLTSECQKTRALILKTPAKSAAVF